MGLRTKTILFIISIVITPIIISTIVFFGFLANVIKDTENQVNEIEESFYQIEQQIHENYSSIHNRAIFFEKLQPLLEENQLRLQVMSLDGKKLFDSEEYMETEKFDGLWNFFQRFNEYTISVIQDNKKVANAQVLATPQSPPAFTVNASFFLAIAISVAAGFVTFILLMVFYSIYVSRNILTPLEKLDLAMQYVSEGDYTFDFKVKEKNEMGRLALSFKEMREKLQASLKKQEQYEQGRKELIASISHDLRTPLASIQGYVEGLKDEVTEDPEQKRRYLSIIQKKSAQLNRLIEDLFEFSKIELNQLQMDLVPMESGWLNEIFSQIAYDAKQLKLDLEYRHDLYSIPLMIDPDRLYQVLANLIQNASRHINEQTGKISIITSLDSDGGWFVIKVKDNGVGIPAEDLPHLFERFYRVEKSRSRQYGGTGLGLSICKAIIEGHHGKIEVDSTEGMGTEFSLYLPVVEK